MDRRSIGTRWNLLNCCLALASAIRQRRADPSSEMFLHQVLPSIPTKEKIGKSKTFCLGQLSAGPCPPPSGVDWCQTSSPRKGILGWRGGAALNMYLRAMLETSPRTNAGFAPQGWLPDNGPAVLASDSQTATPMNAGANEVEAWESERCFFSKGMSVNIFSRFPR